MNLRLINIFCVRFATATDVKREVKLRFDLDLHVSTIKRHRKSMGLEATKPQFVPFIREANKIKRKDFTIQLRDSEDRFNDVIFTDESSFQLGNNRQIVISKIVCDSKGKIVSKDVPRIPRLKHPVKVHVWGGISRNGATQLLVFNGIMDAEFYTNKILKETLLPAINHLYPLPNTHRFWQDNDPKHTSKMAKKFMEDNNINWFKTPAESPDLNMIENVWGTLKRLVRNDSPKNQNELVASILKNWKDHLTVHQCNRYIDHIFKVIPKVIEAEGGFSGC